MATQLPNGKQQFIDSNGDPLALGQVFHYIPNTTTAKDTWQDADQQTLNTNPIDLDSGGYAVIFGNGAYRQVVYDADANLIWDQLTYGSLDQAVIFGGQIVGTPNDLIINPETPVAVLVDGLIIEAFATQDNTGATTLNVSGIGAYPVENNGAALSANSITTGNNYGFVWDAANEVFHLLPWERSIISSGSVGPGELAAAAIGVPINCTLSVSVATSAMTIALKTLAGTDPTVLDPVKVPVMDSAGGYSVLSITSALSLTVSSGSTLGMTNSVLAPLWVVLFNDGGTPRLGIVNTVIGQGNIFGLSPDQIYSSTAEGGAGGADSAGVIYTGTAVTSKSLAILARMESTQTTVGTWAATPSKISLMRPWLVLPGRTYAPLQVLKTNTFGSPSTSFTDITDMALSPTLHSACNQVLLSTSSMASANSGLGAQYRFARGGSAIFVGDVAGSRTPVTFGAQYVSDSAQTFPFAFNAVDMPNSTTPSYTLQIRSSSGGNAAIMGRSFADADTAATVRGVSIFMACEIAT